MLPALLENNHTNIKKITPQLTEFLSKRVCCSWWGHGHVTGRHAKESSEGSRIIQQVYMQLEMKM